MGKHVKSQEELAVQASEGYVPPAGGKHKKDAHHDQ